MSSPFEKGEMAFYTTLDCVLDTRLGCLRYHFPDNFATQEASMRTLLGYGSRVYERFPCVGNEKFLELYAKRDKEVLKLSAPTLLIDEILKFAVQVQADNAAKGNGLVPKLVLNLHPYKLTDEKELSDLKIAMRVMTCNELDIELIDKPVSELTAKYCKDRFACMAMYNYNEWLDYNMAHSHFEQTMLPEVTLMVPHVWFNDKLDEKDFEKMRNGKKLVDTLEDFSSYFVGLQYVPIYVFCYRGALTSMQVENAAKEIMQSTQKHQSTVST